MNLHTDTNDWFQDPRSVRWQQYTIMPPSSKKYNYTVFPPNHLQFYRGTGTLKVYHKEGFPQYSNKKSHSRYYWLTSDTFVVNMKCIQSGFLFFFLPVHWVTVSLTWSQNAVITKTHFSCKIVLWHSLFHWASNREK